MAAAPGTVPQIPGQMPRGAAAGAGPGTQVPGATPLPPGTGVAGRGPGTTPGKAEPQQLLPPAPPGTVKSQNANVQVKK